ncbi:hypothetical protein [Williamsia limnetica]|uniref:hypothetical protein n=1 Tax=Williamsia limnetica TaxID=882452 RepID=UPI001FEAFA34|nr:hypothetical protein [Williamsia limnetica]
MLFGVLATSVLQSSTDGLFDLLCWDADGFGDCYCDRVCGTGEYGHSDGAAYILGGANGRMRNQWHSHVGIVSATQSVVLGRLVVGSSSTAAI